MNKNPKCVVCNLIYTGFICPCVFNDLDESIIWSWNSHLKCTTIETSLKFSSKIHTHVIVAVKSQTEK